jgi:WD40 repeat protein
MKTQQYMARFASKYFLSSKSIHMLDHNMAVRALAFDRTSASLISAGEDLHVFVSDVETQQRMHTFVGHSDWISSISAHPVNKDMFLTTSLDKTIKVWSTKQQSAVNSLNLGSPVWGAAYSPTGDYFAAVTENGTISVINCKELSSLLAQ